MKLRHFNLLGEQFDPPLSKYRGAVVTVHGANTRGAWQKDITPILQDACIRHEAVDYGTKFLSAPFPWTIDRICDLILQKYVEQKRHGAPAAIAHSLGSFALGKALQRWADLTFKRVIMCGCILPRDFPWREISNRGQVERVLNEVAAKDFWARIAPLVPRWGDAGRKGFLEGEPLVHNSMHEWSHHSTMQTRLHCKETWVPFLLGEDSRPQKGA